MYQPVKPCFFLWRCTGRRKKAPPNKTHRLVQGCRNSSTVPPWTFTHWPGNGGVRQRLFHAAVREWSSFRPRSRRFQQNALLSGAVEAELLSPSSHMRTFYTSTAAKSTRGISQTFNRTVQSFNASRSLLFTKERYSVPASGTRGGAKKLRSACTGRSAERNND